MTRIDLHPFELPLGSPLRSSSGMITERSGIAVLVETDEGVGVGEATPLIDWTESLAVCQSTLQELMAKHVEDPTRLPLPRDSPAARHAIQLAVLDYAARQEECSLATYLAGKSATREVAINATIGNEQTDIAVELARTATTHGYSVVKCKVGNRSISEEEDRLSAVREAVDADTEIRLDANQSWTVEQAQAIWPALEALGVTYVEEPIREPSLEAITAIDTDIVGIALDETLVAHQFEIDQWLPAIDAAILKPMALGGIDRAMDIGVRAIAQNVVPVVSGTIDAVIARAAGLHLAAALPTTPAAGLGTGEYLERDLASAPYELEDGCVFLSDAHGIGTLGPWEADV